MKQGNAPGMKNARRLRALSRLETVLQSGVRELNDGTTIKLEEKDIKRIEKEVSVLRSRVTSPAVAETLKTKRHRGPK